MKYYLITLFYFAFQFTACDEPVKKKKMPPINQVAKSITPDASLEVHQFFDWWLGQSNQIVNLNDQFRAKLFYKRDVKELFSYLKKNGLKASLFEGIQDTIDGLSYRRFNPSLIQTPSVKWIDQDRLRSCRKISKDAMWDCLAQDYGIKDYYYVSLPLFSSDKKWALVSINYMEVSGKKSNGANRLFKKNSTKTWEEVAILTFWGNFRTD
jgi:hypothetical protein